MDKRHDHLGKSSKFPNICLRFVLICTCTVSTRISPTSKDCQTCSPCHDMREAGNNYCEILSAFLFTEMASEVDQTLQYCHFQTGGKLVHTKMIEMQYYELEKTQNQILYFRIKTTKVPTRKCAIITVATSIITVMKESIYRRKDELYSNNLLI